MKRYEKATKAGQTFKNEFGNESGYCVCGCRPSVHPDDCNGGLDYCECCGYVTCGACREFVNGTAYCTTCAAKRHREDKE